MCSPRCRSWRHRGLPAGSTRPLFAERSIASTTSTERSPMLASAQFSTGLPRSQAEALLNTERALLTNFNTSFDRLPQKLDGPPDPAQLSETAARLAASRKALDALAPDLKSENEPRLQAFDRQWQKY